MPATENDPITDVQLFHDLPDDAPDDLRAWADGDDMAAYRFATDDGRVSWVPLSTQLLADPATDAEQTAREMAVRALGLAASP